MKIILFNFVCVCVFCFFSFHDDGLVFTGCEYPKTHNRMFICNSDSELYTHPEGKLRFLFGVISVLNPLTYEVMLVQ